MLKRRRLGPYSKSFRASSLGIATSISEDTMSPYFIMVSIITFPLGASATSTASYMPRVQYMEIGFNPLLAISAKILLLSCGKVLECFF